VSVPGPAHPDPLWQEVLELLARHPVAPGRMLAPRELGPLVEGSIPYERAGQVELSSLDCLVLHKGWLGQLPPSLLRETVRSRVPAFANPVFVVYARDFAEPLHAPDDLKSFLEQVPASAQEAPPLPVAVPSPPPLAVYAGKGRLICRDPSYRKLLIPSGCALLLGALMEGRDVVTALREELRPWLGGARGVIELGAGVGLFSLAARELAAEDAWFEVLETDAAVRGCLVANVELAGLYWRTEVLEAPSKRWGRARRASSKERSTPCDVVHVDAQAWPRARARGLEAILRSVGRPPLVLSRGLGYPDHALAAPDGSARESASSELVGRLASLGYQEEPAGAKPAVPGLAELRVFRAPKA
jgi:hypothetical protein